MARIRSVVILTHSHQGLAPDSNLRLIAEGWARRGIGVTVHQGLTSPPPADAAVLHLDLTELPADYVALARRYPIHLNTRPRSIAKREVSRNLVTADDAYDGPVVVKTDRNHAGRPERLLALSQAGPLWRLREAVARFLPPAWSGRLPHDRYLALPGKALVPRWVWRAPQLVVERLRVERQGEHYVLRQWYCFGDRGLVSSYLASEPIVKQRNIVGRLPLSDAVPASVAAERARLGLDFGKFDYVIEDGEAALFDANRTPNHGDHIGSERCARLCGHLAEGLDFYARSA
jgi:hypothetical protein